MAGLAILVLLCASLPYMSIVPADVIIDQDEHLVTGTLLPMLGIDGLRLHTPEEPLRGGVVRRTAFGCVSASWRPQYRHYFSAA